MVVRTFQYRIVQQGSLPLCPTDEINRDVPHACTSVLVWPEGERPNRENTLLTDPCFVLERSSQLNGVLGDLGIGLPDIGRIYVTHPHHDHMPNVAGLSNAVTPMFGVVAAQLDLPDGLSVTPCPGHHPLLAPLVVGTNDGMTWIVGDAILGEDWLRAWRYYWPNGYSPDEIVETWRSAARILATADVVIPGHGPPFRVDISLINDLMDGFSRAECSRDCPEVLQNLSQRIEQLRAD
jgi:glyoxylase-like metal-dependent hydrolase (beta-lactamase superfamily II)